MKPNYHAAKNPFPGLRPFEQHESAMFFGREEQTDQLLEKLQSQRFLAVVGDSGSGKSSLVRAGLLPSIRLGYLGTGSHWRVALMRPGSAPMRQLVHSLTKPDVFGKVPQLRETLERSSRGLVEATRKLQGSPFRNLLLVVDQFEEMLRHVRELGAKAVREEEAAFLRLLLASSEETEFPIYIVLTMRSEFLGDCARFRGLPEALNAGQYLIPRMTRDQLQEAIEGPVAASGAQITQRLVQRLLNDASDDPDQLPILQHVLMRIWMQSATARAEGKPVDLTHYHAVHGMDQCLNIDAHAAYKELPEEDQPIARKIFKHLTQSGRNRGQETRRMATLEEIRRVTGIELKRLKGVISCFRGPGRHFLTSPDKDELHPKSDIDISHESLIRLWGDLQNWVEEETNSARVYRRLTDSAERGLAYYKNPELKEALEWRKRETPNGWWAKRYDRDPGDPEQPSSYFVKGIRFLQKSRWRYRRNRALVAMGIIILVSSAIVSLWFLKKSNDAYKQLAAHRLLILAQVLELKDPALVESRVRFALESMRRTWLPKSDKILRSALDLLPKKEAIFEHDSEIIDVTFSQDGKWVATVSIMNEVNTVRVWEMPTKKEVAKFDYPDRVSFIVLSADGKKIAISTIGEENKTVVREMATGIVEAEIKHDDKVSAVALSADGKKIAISTIGKENKTLVREVATRIVEAEIPHTYGVRALAFSSDGNWLASGGDDELVSIWNAKTAELKHWFAHKDSESTEVRNALQTVAFSRDGKKIASGSDDKTVRVWEVEPYNDLGFFEHDGAVFDLVFSPDGKWIATGSEDQTARVWELATQKEVARVEHEGIVRAVAFSPDGKRVASGGYGKIVRVWKVARLRYGSKVCALACNSDDKWVVGARDDKTVRVWDVETDKIVGRFEHNDTVSAAAFSPDGKNLATAAVDKTVRVWEMATKKKVAQFKHGGIVSAMAFSPDGKRMAAVGLDRTVRVWEVESGKELGLFEHGDIVSAVAFSPDGKRLATASMDTRVRVWEVDSEKPVAEFKPSASGLTNMQSVTVGVKTVAFSPDGKQIASGGEDKFVRVWEVESGKELGLFEHGDIVSAVAFSPDGKRIASGSVDRTTRVWEITHKEPVMQIEHDTAVKFLAFSRQGNNLATATDHVVAIQPHSGEHLMREVCDRLARSLNPTEWKECLHEEAYIETCRHLP